ncbi:MAG TPA: hypothetical protein VMT85_18185 [Thermoanaerobaculia bacterium]|nr:hypothetical protein [Thermoanaerobaculia bacterium]
MTHETNHRLGTPRRLRGPALLATSALLVAWTTTPGLASPAPDARSDLRGDLLDLIGALETLPPAAQDQVFGEEIPWSTARAEVLEMDAAQLRAIEEMLGPNSLVGSLTAVFDGLRVPAASRGGLGRHLLKNAEEFRASLAELSDGLHAMEDRLPPGLAVRLADLDRVVSELDSAQMVQVMSGLGAERSRWDGTPDGALRLGASIAGCIGDFPAKQICEIGALFDEIVSFFTVTVPAFFVDVFETAVAGLESLFAAVLDLIPTPEEFLAATGLTEPGWWNDVVGIVPDVLGSEGSSVTIPTTEGRVAAAAGGGILPCPAGGTDIFLIGEVGTIDGYYSCKRSLEFLFGQVFKVLPKDEWGLTPKIVAAVLYFPTRFLCTCYEKELFVTFWDDQLSHIADRTPDLDVTVSSRASAFSLDNVATTAAQLDGSAATVDELADSLLTASSGLLADGVTHQARLAELQDQRLRDAIAQDLGRTANSAAIALFQLPESFGGLLGEVRSAVEETVAAASDAGANTTQAEGWLADALALEEVGAFKQAYASYRKAYQSALGALR